MNSQLSQELLDRRRDLVRHLHYSSLSVSLIVQRMAKHDGLFPPSADYDEKMRAIANDIAVLKREAMEAIAIEDYDAKLMHAEYIDRSRYLYSRALQDGNVPVAHELSKSIARAYGVQTDEAIVVKGDILSLFRAANDQAKKKREIAEQKVIDVTPETILQEPRRLPADAILVTKKTEAP